MTYFLHYEPNTKKWLIVERGPYGLKTIIDAYRCKSDAEHDLKIMRGKRITKSKGKRG